MRWTVLIHSDFAAELAKLPLPVQDELLAHAKLLEHFGPRLGRPWVDTLKGSKFPNMKELRFKAANGTWRVLFAFDPCRRAILLAAGDKAGVAQRRFYKNLLALAERRLTKHLAKL